MSDSLYKMTRDIIAVKALLEDSSVPEEAINDTLDGLEMAVADKAHGLGAMMLEWEAYEGSVKEAADRMLARHRALRSKRERLKGYLLNCMVESGVEQIKCPEFEITVVKNPPAVEILEESDIPPAFMEVKLSKKPVKKAIKEAIQKGEDVPGAILTEGKRLRIK